MANTLKFGNGEWYGKKDTILAYNDENSNYKPLPFDFSRASKATVINKDGLIETVGSGQPRIDYKDDSKGALLLESSRSNLITYSEDFSNAYWNKFDSSVTSGFVSPDGSTNAFKLIEGNANTQHGLLRSNFSINVQRTLSVFVKKGENERFFISDYNKFGYTIGVIFNLTSGTIESNQDDSIYLNPKIESYLNGWYKCSVTWTNTTGLSVPFFGNAISGTNSYQGDGESGIYVWGAQLEQESYATSYIPTQGSSVTRLADVCLQENLLTDIINASYPFTMYVDGKYNGQLSTLLSFLNIDASQQFFLIYIFNNEVLFSARSNGTIERIESNINLVDGQEYKIAVTMESSTNGKICVNGNSVTVKNNFSSQIQNSNITDLLIGQERVVADGGVRSSVSSVKIYNEALTDQELIALTS